MIKQTLRHSGICLAVLLAIFLIPGCSNDNDPVAPPVEQSQPPKLPSMSTMTFDLDFFGVALPAVDQSSVETGKPGPELQAAGAATRSNWINAVVRALFVHLLVFDALDEPIGAFAIAVHSVPQKQADGSWLWTYIFVDEGAEYSIFLYGKQGTGYVDWRMEVSTNNAQLSLDHFMWFEGRTQNDNSEGYWQFYDPVIDGPALTSAATDGVKTARIDYENASAREHRLTVTINGEGREDEGDYLEFYESATMGSIDHYDASEDLSSNITYYSDGSGSITVPDYNNGQQACWDTHQEDVDC